MYVFRCFEAFIIFMFFFFFSSNPPLEEDDVPPGEWLCHKCRVAPKTDVSCEVSVVDL